MELEMEARAADLLPATVLSLAASIWPQQSRPGRVKPRVMRSCSRASPGPLFPSDLRGPFCVGTIIAKAQTSKHKKQLSSTVTTARRGPSGFLQFLNFQKKKNNNNEGKPEPKMRSSTDRHSCFTTSSFP